MSGRRGTAPCGHPGEYVVGTYVRCLSGCDSNTGSGPVTIIADFEDEEPTQPLCPNCGSANVQPLVARGGLGCWQCWHAWLP